MWSRKDRSKLMGMAGLVALTAMLPAVNVIAQEQEAATAGEPEILYVGPEIAPLSDAVSGVKVLLYNAALDNGDGLKSALVDTGLFAASDIDVQSISSTPPSLDFLQQYQCVITFTDYTPSNPVADGDRLKEYVDAGGAVVITTYAYSNTSSPWEIQGGIMEPGYSPLVNSNTPLTSFPRSLDFATANTTHSMLDGVTDFTYGGNFNYTQVGLVPGAVLVGSDNYGVPLLAISSSGRVAGINVFPGTYAFSKTPGVYRTIANACISMSKISVIIDIKPGSTSNSINLCSKGVVPVAIMGSDTFNVNDINQTTLTLAGATVKAVKNRILCGTEDVNVDGYDDLVCHFNTTELALDKTSTSATVKGKTVEGTPIEGSDSVVIVKDGCL